ncbi:MAG: hypothetical protein ACK4WJ_06370 [Endomicrobiia bacterium]
MEKNTLKEIKARTYVPYRPNEFILNQIIRLKNRVEKVILLLVITVEVK